MMMRIFFNGEVQVSYGCDSGDSKGREGHAHRWRAAVAVRVHIHSFKFLPKDFAKVFRVLADSGRFFFIWWHLGCHRFIKNQEVCSKIILATDAMLKISHGLRAVTVHFFCHVVRGKLNDFIEITQPTKLAWQPVSRFFPGGISDKKNWICRQAVICISFSSKFRPAGNGHEILVPIRLVCLPRWRTILSKFVIFWIYENM